MIDTDIIPNNELDLSLAPPIWWAFRDQEPARPISYCIVTINGRRVGRIDKPDVMRLDEEMLLQRFPSLYDTRQSEVRLDFRAQRGRGALGQVTVTFGDMTQQENENSAQAAPNAEVALVEWAQRIMMQNERLQTKLMEQVQQNATNSMDSHERLINAMSLNMERDRQRHSDWLEREGQLRASQANANAERAAANGQSQAQMLEMILPLLAGGTGAQMPNAFMEQIQNAVMEKLLGGALDKIESMGSGDADPMQQLLGAVGPMLAAKFGGGAEPEPPKPTE